jgi:hypothetical protein
MTFPGIQVYGLESIDPGLFDAHYHNHGDLNVVFTLDLELDGVWQTVTSLQADNNDHPISDFAPASFTPGILTGIRFTDTPTVGNGYHSFTETVSFTFSDTPSGVPEPGTVGLMAMGACCLLLGRRRAMRLAGRP